MLGGYCWIRSVDLAVTSARRVLGGQYSDICFFHRIDFVLTLRPSGLLGERGPDRPSARTQIQQEHSS
jgi:hypothetical protein